MSSPGGIGWWLCQPSVGRALLCGGGAVYLGTFLGVDAVTAFCAAQVARFTLRALGRRRLVHGGARVFGRRWRDRARLEPIGPYAETDAMSDGRYEEAHDGSVPRSEPERELTLSELIAGDPGPEPGHPGPEFPEPAGNTRTANGGDAARIAPGLDGHVGRSSNDTVPTAGSDAAEALRMAVAETR